MRRPQHVIGVAAGVSLACALGGAATASAATPPAGAATRAASPVIVVLANQSGRPAATESPVISQVKAAGGTNVIGFGAVASFAATVTPAEAQSLAANPAVASVAPDQKISVTPVPAGQVPAGQVPAGQVPAGQVPASQVPASQVPASRVPVALPGLRMGRGSGPSAICGTPAEPLLPEDLTTTHASEVHVQGITGAGVTVAFIADGLDPGNPDFIRNGKSIFKDYADFSGDGPGTQTGGEEAFGDASMIAAQGNGTYDLSSYDNPAYPLPRNCDIKIEGMAPGASLIGLKADGRLFFSTSSILQSIDYAITHGVNVLNESFGENAYSDNNARDAIQLFNDAAVRHGITVTVATGDAGISGTQASPSTDPNVISAGASTDFQSYEQTGYAGARFFSSGRWVADNVSALSSGGISQGGQVPDLVAPGESDWALCSTDTATFTECLNYDGKPTPFLLFGGTSEASPVTAGAAALVIQAYRQYHHGASPSPALVKQFLTSTATDLSLPAPEQGSGLLNAEAAVQAAENYRGGNTRHQPDQVVTTPDQTLLTGAPGAPASTSLAVTNTGRKAEKVSLGTRTYAQTSSYQASVALNPVTDPTFPYPTNGLPWAYKKVTFHVGSGAARLGVSIDWTGDPEGVPGGSVVRLTLIGPDGAFVTNTRPQGVTVSANHGFVDVAHPEGGTWTAVLYTPAKAAAVTGQPHPYTGHVILDAYTQKTVPEGSVSPPALILGPGQTGYARLNTSISGDAGDTAESVTLATSGGQRASVPVVLRPVIPIAAGRGTFTGMITGGNGRAGTPAQTNTYAFDVPGGRQDLDVGIRLDGHPDVAIEGDLIDPDGENIDVGTNVTSVNATTGVTSSGPSLQLVQNAPEAGRWRLVLIVVGPVSGAEVSQGFSGTIGFNEVSVSADLPASAAAKLTAGQAASYTITYGNHGSAAEPVQVDPRLDGTATVTLPSLSGTPAVTLPVTASNAASIPFYEVPPGTSQLTVAAMSSAPAQAELSAPLGEPDVLGGLDAAQPGDLASVARVTEAGGRHQLARGFWGTFMQEIGPFGDAGRPAGTSTLTATARTQPLDPSVTSAAGDPYAPGFTGAAPGGTPVVVNPGRTGSIQVTITPAARAGTVVHGVIYLVTSPFTGTGNLNGALGGGLGAVQTSGDVLAAVPYTYTVG
ncbi:MAG: S8 family serine peptidase [Streptosporangiaceae bacterium]